MLSLNRSNLRHFGTLLRLGNRPATSVYDSIGSDFFLAPAPHWLNVGLWEGTGGEAEAPVAVRRLVVQIASALPKAGVIIDVGNGLGAQDPVIAEIARPRVLIAVNITPSQLVAGKTHLAEAGASGVAADAVRLPIADGSADGVISVEAAFHFSSRPDFFRQCFRILSPGGVVSTSDFVLLRRPSRLREKLLCLAAIRVWGVRADAVVSSDELRRQAQDAGLVDVHIEVCGETTIDPAIELFKARILSKSSAPPIHRSVAKTVVQQWSKLRKTGIMEYALLTAAKPLEPSAATTVESRS